MAVLCIGAKQIKVLWGFSDDGCCTVTGHKLNDRKARDRQCNRVLMFIHPLLL